jgi:hypothetical protein
MIEAERQWLESFIQQVETKENDQN